jgi:hypothetical protein
MPKCVLGHDNPPGERFCRQCGRKINPMALPQDPTTEDLQAHLERIRSLEQGLVERETEINNLRERLNQVAAEGGEPSGQHPEVAPIVQQLNDKDREQQNTLQELDDLRDVQSALPQSSPGTPPHLSIEAYPIPNPAIATVFDDQHASLDLSTTAFRIRATLERNADASVDLVIHPGATINVKAPGEKRWRRLEGGARLNAEAGMVLFDPKGVVNARFDRPN